MTERQERESLGPHAARADVAFRLRARAAEIQAAIVSRIEKLWGSSQGGRPAQLPLLRTAGKEILAYGIEALENEIDVQIPMPTSLLRQVREAAREGVELDLVLRGLSAGAKSLEEFVVLEAEGIPIHLLCQILGELGHRMDTLLESFATEYRTELERASRPRRQREADLVARLLEVNGPVAPGELDYDLGLWHVAVIINGPSGELRARAIGERLGLRALVFPRGRDRAWAWLGGAQATGVDLLAAEFERERIGGLSIALGEPRKGHSGWRQTFREAEFALQVALRFPGRVTKCREAILAAAILRDPALVEALLGTYLLPLEGRGATGPTLRSTLRAYFKANQNAAAAASALGVARHTVERRLRSVEARVGQLLDTCNAQLQIALLVEELLQ